jgi:hypothetical protein
MSTSWRAGSRPYGNTALENDNQSLQERLWELEEDKED